jgi:hypothetical protein
MPPRDRRIAATGTGRVQRSKRGRRTVSRPGRKAPSGAAFPLSFQASKIFFDIAVISGGVLRLFGS